MAESLPSSQPGASAPSRMTQGWRRNGPPRLRESCEPCSAAKVRCSKDKPCCSRCLERDLPCVYFATRRSGRPPNKGSNGGKTTSRSSDTFHFPAVQTSSSLETLPGQSCFATFPSTNHPESMHPESMHPAPTPPGLELHSSSSSFSLDTLPEWSPRELDEFFTTFVSAPDIDKPWLFPDGFSDTDGIVSPLDLMSTSPSSGQNPPKPDCDCLTTALKLLAKSDSPASHNVGHSRGPLSSTEKLISENESIASSVETILQCNCAQDSQVLIVLALVVSKVLGRYRIAAGVASGVPTETPSQSPYLSAQYQYAQADTARVYDNGEDRVRSSGQMVLGELHRALKLVNELAARLVERGSCYGQRDGMRPTSSSSTSQRSFDEASIVSFSSTTLDQLGTDLRDQLKSLATTITMMLQGSTWKF